MVESHRSDATAQESGGITRREALKKGALLGGALVWSTPLVQAIGMRPALAQEVSPACEVRVSFLPGTPVICLIYPPELCECLAACGPDPTAACIGACFAAFTPIGDC